MVPYIPVRAKIFHMLPGLVENLRSLIASQYAETDRAICGRGNFILCLSHQKHRLSVANWNTTDHRIIQAVVTGRRCQSRSGSASGTLCSRWHAKALLHGTLQSTSTDGSLTVLHRPESRCLEETGKSSSTKCRTYKTSSKNFD